MDVQIEYPVPPWPDLIGGQVYEFGMLSIDIKGHSAFNALDPKMVQTRKNLERLVRQAVFPEGLVSWAGDGGIAFYRLDRRSDYDTMAKAAIQICHAMHTFNHVKVFGNQLLQSIHVRIVCHAGEMVYSNNSGQFSSNELNDLAKNERDLGLVDQVTLTAQAYNGLSKAMQDLFGSEVPVQSRSGSKSVYRYVNQSQEFCPLSTRARGNEELPLQRISAWGSTEAGVSYILVKTKDFKGCQQKVRAYFAGRTRAAGERPDVSDVQMWTLWGAAEMLIRFTADAKTSASVFTSLQDEVEHLVRSENDAWVPLSGGDHYAQVGMHGAVQPVDAAPDCPLIVLEDARTIKGFIYMKFDNPIRLDTKGKVIQDKLRLPDHRTAVESYFIAMQSAKYATHFLIEVHLPCGRHTELTKLSLALEDQVSGPEYSGTVRQTGLAYAHYCMKPNGDWSQDPLPAW